MPIIDKPTSATELEIDIDTITDELFALEKEDDGKYGNLEGWIRDRFSAASEKRDSDEQRWLQAYKNYRGG